MSIVLSPAINEGSTVQAATEALETVSRGVKTQFKRDANRMCRSAREPARLQRLPYHAAPAARGERGGD
jgi:hypothetical protein